MRDVVRRDGGQETLGVGCLEGAAEVEALSGVASLVLEPQELVDRLDALGHGLEAQRAAELDQRVDERGAGPVRGGSEHEGPVDLDDVHGELLEVGQRRVARAEVVDGEADAEVLQRP